MHRGHAHAVKMGWEATISEAYGLSKKLKDSTFLQLFKFFSMLMPEVDVLYKILQKPTTDATGVSSVLIWVKANVENIRQQTERLADEPGRRVTNTAPLMNEACNIIISQAQQRLSKGDHLIATKPVDNSLFLSLLNPLLPQK